MEAARNWFASLSRREQILIGVAGTLLLATIAIFGIIRPLWLGSFEAQRSFQETAYKAAELDARYNMLKSAPPAPAQSVTASLPQFLTIEAEQRGITLAANNPSGNGGASIVIDSINPNSFLQWALALENQNIILAQLSMQPVPAGGAGLVSVRADFDRLGAN